MTTDFFQMEENHKLIKQSTNFWRTEGANEYFVLPFYIDALNNFKVARVDGGAWRHSRKRPHALPPQTQSMQNDIQTTSEKCIMRSPGVIVQLADLCD